MNKRQIELIQKKWRGTITEEETKEFQKLQPKPVKSKSAKKE